MHRFSFFGWAGLLISACGFGLQVESQFDPASSKMKVHVEFSQPRFEDLSGDLSGDSSEDSSEDSSRDVEGVRDIRIEGVINTIEAGLPSLPVKQLRIALPNGTRLLNHQIHRSESRFFGQEIRLNPAQLPISWRSGKFRTSPAHAPAHSGMHYPENSVKVEIQKLHGVNIALISIYPVQVVIGKKEARFTPSYDIELSLGKDRGLTTALYAHQFVEANRFVDNPAVVDSYPHDRTPSRENYDYLILTTTKVISYQGANGLGDLTKDLEVRGLKSKTLNVANLTAAGTDQIEKMRNTIRQEYAANGIRYVLLLGRSIPSTKESFLPSPKLWTKIKAYFGNGWVDLEEFIAADLYYSNLDGSFNGNGNEKWGETIDGDNGADVDFLSEVRIGRVSVNTDEELQNFVKKNSGSAKRVHGRNVLFLGESLFPELGLYGDDYMDQLIGNSSDHGFSTTGYSNAWGTEKLYDKAKGWSGQQAQTKINQSQFSMINHLGHSNQSYNMKLSSASIAKFSNANPYFYYTQGCFAGDFATGSWTERLVNTTHGAFAAIANSSYGLAPEDPTPATTKTPGGSQMLHRQFIHAIFSKGEGVLARAHQMSKEAFLELKAAQEVRWVNWAATYFGDPSLEFKVE